jgi:ParB family chromosome partitioning protein
MQIIYKNIKDIKKYKNNPRKNELAVEKVAESIKEFGFRNPILIDKDNEIVCGHTRYDAAKKLGIKEVPCIMADDLTPEQIKAFRLVDNKTNEYADWDFDLLNIEIKGIDIDLGEWDLEYQEKPDIREFELKPYQKVHYLISIDINNNDKIIELIEKIKDIGGVEVESTLN